MSEPSTITARLGAITITAPADDHIGRQYERGTWYESGMLAYIRNKGAGLTIMDVGAFVGGHALYFALECKAARVIAIEPNPKAYTLLERNVLQNNATDTIETIQAAAGVKRGRAKMGNSRSDNLGGTYLVPDSRGDVQVDRLDTIWKHTGEPHIDILKIDAEGMGPAVLEGAPRLLKVCQPLIFIECNLSELDDVRGILLPMGYRQGAMFNATPTYEFIP